MFQLINNFILAYLCQLKETAISKIHASTCSYESILLLQCIQAKINQIQLIKI